MKKLLSAFAVLLFVLCAASFAQESPSGNEADDLAFIAVGTVVRAGGDRLVTLEYVYETDEKTETTYIVNAKTEFETYKDLSEVKPGDTVEIVYSESEEGRVAKSVSKEAQDEYLDQTETDPEEQPATGKITDGTTAATGAWPQDIASNAVEDGI